MRILKDEITIIKNVLSEYLDDAKIILFGSRLYDDKKGGDIDILVETKYNLNMREKLEILTKIELNGVLRKVDMLFKTPISKKSKIFDTIKKDGIVL